MRARILALEGEMPRSPVPACVLAAASVLLAGLATPAALPGAQPDGAAGILFRQMRDAIGADALAKLQTFSVRGSTRVHAGGKIQKGAIAWTCALPDRCFKVVSYVSGIASSTSTTGFNGDEPVRYGRRPGRTTGLPRNPRWMVAWLKREFSVNVLPLLGDVPFQPYRADLVADETIENRTVHGLALRTTDGFFVRLRIDAVTHLPVMLSWKDPDMGWAIDPWTADGEHKWYFSDFRRDDGLLWPHRLTEYVDGQLHREIVMKYTINPRIDPRRFEPIK